MPRTPPAAYLIDAPIYVFRAYHSLPTTLTDGQGRPVNAVYGYAQFLCGLLRGERPLYCAAAFDESLTRSFRNEWFEAYKANREEPPPDLEAQFAFCKRLTRALGVLTYASRRFEADDLIATAAKGLRSEGLSVVIVSRDKDLAQILEPGDCLWDGTGGPRLGPADIRARLGVQPSQISDYLGLVGDPVDNIPGVPGIGPGAARQLLERFDTLDDLYRCLDTVARLDIRGASRLRGLLEQHRDQAFLSRRLATLHTGARILRQKTDLLWRGPKDKALARLFRDLGFDSRLMERCLKGVREEGGSAE